jgi:hypothetical protein
MVVGATAYVASIRGGWLSVCPCAKEPQARSACHLVKRLNSINYHCFGQQNSLIGLSGIFLITDDVIDRGVAHKIGIIFLPQTSFLELDHVYIYAI